jgi:hypothetical protein
MDFSNNIKRKSVEVVTTKQASVEEVEIPERKIIEIVQESFFQSTGKRIRFTGWDVAVTADYDHDAWAGSSPIGHSARVRKMTFQVVD